ncbi:MAG: hypothetical protein SFU91_12320 [Chloroherpetonaceae bacterium]|nr:hypothetical protein [Chloroherpetonaceae bacterium]
MKNRKYDIILVFIVTIFMSCNTETDMIYHFETISFSQLPIKADSGFYVLDNFDNINFGSSYAKRAADSIITELTNASVKFDTAWVQSGESECGSLQVIVFPRLVIKTFSSSPIVLDKFGFVPYDGLIQFWNCWNVTYMRYSRKK